MIFGMIGQDEVNYTNEVKNYVEGVLNASLAASVEGDPAREHTNLTLLQKLLLNNGEREKVINRIVAHSIKYSMPSYKANLQSNDRRTVFMRQIYSFLDMHQISLLAVHFDKQIELEKSEEHSR